MQQHAPLSHLADGTNAAENGDWPHSGPKSSDKIAAANTENPYQQLWPQVHKAPKQSAPEPFELKTTTLCQYP